MQQAIDLNDHQYKSKKADMTMSAPVDNDGDASTTDDSNEEDIDDQTEALLKGFESDDDIEKDPDDQGYEVGDEIPKLGKKLKKKAKKAAEKSSASGKPGVVYIGRIPHGFYEQEMKQYFSQFGSIKNLRLSRNRKTGKSKHFAFVEFESAEVAEIVSKTMDNYLLFGHILKCKLVAPEQVHKDLWIGANKRFKSVPWNKIQGRQLSQAMMVSGWEMRVAKEEKRRADKKATMKLMDYDFESPKLKSPKDVLKKSQQALMKPVSDDESDEKSDEKEPKKVEAPKKMERQAVTAKSEKDKKQQNSTVATAKPSNSVAEAAEDLLTVTAEPGKKKKNRKAKSSRELVDAEGLKQSVSTKQADADSAQKVKKGRKR
jgi:nucleolar protein 15